MNTGSILTEKQAVDVMTQILKESKGAKEPTLCWLTWNCPKCGEQAIAAKPYAYNTGGYPHGCGGVYKGDEFVVLVMSASIEGGDELARDEIASALPMIIGASILSDVINDLKSQGVSKRKLKSGGIEA